VSEGGAPEDMVGGTYGGLWTTGRSVPLATTAERWSLLTCQQYSTNVLAVPNTAVITDVHNDDIKIKNV